MDTFIDSLKERVLRGGEIAFEEAIRLLGIEDPQQIDHLLAAAHEITAHFHSRDVGLCSLVNAKSYLCGEDCAFCAQSVRFDTGVDRYPLMEAGAVVQAAKESEKRGIKDFCVVTSGGELNDEEFERVVGIFGRLKAETALNLDGSLGYLTPERLRRLKAAGLRRVNSNVQTSKRFYPAIVSTHTHEDRLRALQVLRDENVQICAGGILGLGETREDRIQMAFELKPYAPHCLPVNILNPRPGTPLENQPRLDPVEVVKTVAVFRFIHPKANIKLAGGRERNLGNEFQLKALRGGANGLVIGGYLTTKGNPVAKDFQMLKQAGFSVPKTEEPAHSAAAG